MSYIFSLQEQKVVSNIKTHVYIAPFMVEVEVGPNGWIASVHHTQNWKKFGCQFGAASADCFGCSVSIVSLSL